MSKCDDLINCSPAIYDAVMSICEDAMRDDNELEALARKMQLYFEEHVNLRYGMGV